MRTFGNTAASGAFLALSFGLAATQTAFAQDNYPKRPITTIYPYSAGSAAGVALRTIAEAAGELMGQPVLFEEKAGAAGRLAIDAMISAAPDGYTLSWAGDSVLVTQPLADPAFQFALGEDYTPIVLALRTPLMLAINPDLPFDDVAGLVAYAKEHPGELSIGNSGFGTGNHVAAVALANATGIDVLHVPYQGAAAALPDVLSGVVSMMFFGDFAKTNVEAGKLHAIATTGDTRWSLMPDYPTLIEQGVSVTSYTHFGLVARPDLPEAITSKLEEAFLAAITDPAMQERLVVGGYDTAIDSTATGFANMVSLETERQKPIVAELDLKF